MGWNIVTKDEMNLKILEIKENSFEVVPVEKPEITLMEFFELKYFHETSSWIIHCEDVPAAADAFNLEKNALQLRDLAEKLIIGDSAPITAIPNSFVIVEVDGKYYLQPSFCWWGGRTDYLPEHRFNKAFYPLVDTINKEVKILKLEDVRIVG